MILTKRNVIFVSSAQATLLMQAVSLDTTLSMKIFKCLKRGCLEFVKALEMFLWEEKTRIFINVLCSFGNKIFLLEKKESFYKYSPTKHYTVIHPFDSIQRDKWNFPKRPLPLRPLKLFPAVLKRENSDCLQKQKYIFYSN